MYTDFKVGIFRISPIAITIIIIMKIIMINDADHDGGNEYCYYINYCKQ